MFETGLGRWFGRELLKIPGILGGRWLALSNLGRLHSGNLEIWEIPASLETESCDRKPSIRLEASECFYSCTEPTRRNGRVGCGDKVMVDSMGLRTQQELDRS